MIATAESNSYGIALKTRKQFFGIPDQTNLERNKTNYPDQAGTGESTMKIIAILRAAMHKLLRPPNANAASKDLVLDFKMNTTSSMIPLSLQHQIRRFIFTNIPSIPRNVLFQMLSAVAQTNR
mmetsp:Transcript_15253/g.22525  ORF Transcript_15253/g.22525 Transcript_15253/m.22525 type:complete len:123 (-) Transcript_15253:298-666(-)